jgi:hypothetical protein
MNITIDCYVIKRIVIFKIISCNLVAIRQTTHPAHDPKYVVVYSEHLDGVGVLDILEIEGGIVNAGHIASTGRLVLLGFEGEGVHVNVRLVCSGANGYTFVMLVGLHELVVRGLAGGSAVMTVELDVSLGVGGGVSTDTAVIGILFNPDKLFYGVVEVELEFGLSFLITGELKLLNEVLMGYLGESAALVSVKVDVINIEGGGVECGRFSVDMVLNYSGCGSELYVNFDLVVLKRNER